VAEVYRGSEARDARRPFQGCVAVDPRGRPNPALSRNLKPPALAGGRSLSEGWYNEGVVFERYRDIYFSTASAFWSILSSSALDIRPLLTA
jgi:hypothetical protein